MDESRVIDEGDVAYAGQAVYTRSLLRVYDILVYRFNGPVVWRCRKRDLLDLYDKHVSARHLDIGVGTGYLLDRCRFPVEQPRITLMDLNPNSLSVAARRLRRYGPRTHRANVLDPWQLPAESFDSVAMSNVLHCAPGTLEDKAVALDHARTVLAPGGCLFGSTVLGEGVEHTRLSRMAMKRLNRRGMFSNADDRLEDLDAGLGDAFAAHEIEVRGAIALFAAWTERDGARRTGSVGALAKEEEAGV